MKVSICIPAYNYPALLRRCLSSIIDQSYRNFEVIITDDSRHDELLDVVREFNDDRIKYFKNKYAKGSPENWNQSVSLAIGDVIKIIHHDDWFSSDEALGKIVKVFQEGNDVSFLFCQSYKVYSPKKKSIFKPSVKFINKLSSRPYNLIFQNEIGPPSVIAYRNNSSMPFFNNSSKWYVDVIFYVDLLLLRQKFHYLKEPLINITVGSPLQVTNTTSSIIKVDEAIFTFSKFGYFHRKHLPLLLQLYFIELFRRYKIDNLNILNMGPKSDEVHSKLILPHLISRFPLPYQVYAFIRRCSLRF